jgi:hypothetical protein
MKKIWIYMIGVIPLALTTERLQSVIGGPALLIGAVSYLLVVRLVAERYGK